MLLLIFMLTAPLMYRGIDVNLPKSAGKPTAVEERVVLTVTKDQTIYINEKPVALGAVEPALRDLFKNRRTRRSTSRRIRALVRAGRGDDGPRPSRRHRASSAW